MVPHRRSVPLKQLALFLVPFLVLALPVITHSAFAQALSSNRLLTARGSPIYLRYCATCHGVGGKGDGPVAPALKAPPPDLTTISQRSGGTFPLPRIVRIITYGETISAHGNKEMPVWGVVFSTETGRGRRGAFHSRRAVLDLTRFLEGIQKN